MKKVNIIMPLALAGIAMAVDVNPLLAQKNPAPDPFTNYIVYSAAGVFDPNVPPSEGDLARWFHETIMGRTPVEVEDERRRADQYFEEVFGIPPGSSAAFGLDPRNEYTAYFISGENVPPRGWVVRDGGFIVSIGEGGMNLHGTWGGPEGRWVPEGTIMVFGEYNIAVTGPGRGNSSHREIKDPIISHYESTDPIIPNPHQPEGILFQCRLISGDFGVGLAQGISIPKMTADGRTIANIRNILTFPGLGLEPPSDPL